MERQINKTNTDAALLTQYVQHHRMLWYKAWHKGGLSVFQGANTQGTTSGESLRDDASKKYYSSFIIIIKDNRTWAKRSYSWVPVFWLWTDGRVLTDLDDLFSTSWVFGSHRGREPDTYKSTLRALKHTSLRKTRWLGFCLRLALCCVTDDTHLF